MEKLKQLLSTHNFQKRFDKPKITIEEVEDIIKFKLPEDYILFCSKLFGVWGFNWYGVCSVMEFRWDFGNEHSYQIFEYLPGTIAIGRNGGGEYIAIELLENNRMRFILSPFITIEKEAHVEVGTSFTDFLERLNNGKEWFI